MQLCSTCPLKATNTCTQLCPSMEAYLKSKRNYKTTYVNKEVGLNDVYKNQVNLNLEDFLDTSGSFTEKYGYLLPTIEQIVIDYGTDRQKEIYIMWVSKKMSFPYIAEQLHIKVQSVHEVIYGHRNQGGLVRKIRKHLMNLGKLPEESIVL